MAERGFGLTFELRYDPLSQRLAEFNPPLVERVDGPDRTLGEDAVLVKRNQFSKNFRCQPFGKNRV